MRIGLALPQYGGLAAPAAVTEVATTAESLGFDALWAADRILWPLHPADPYPGGDGSLPEEYATFLDPLTVLTVAAGVTSRVRLGTSTLNALWQPPVLLARTLASLDRVSEGRLDVGIGLGWSSDEYRAAGVPWRGRGARLEETLDVLEALWGPDPVEHNGTLWTVPPSRVGLKPVQRPRPPLLLGGTAPAALERAGRRGEGWLGVGLPVPALTSAWRRVRRAAEAAGRDPDALRRPVRVNPVLTDTPTSEPGAPRSGTRTQYTDYLKAAVAAGADEVLIDLQQTTDTPAHLLDLANDFHAALRKG